MRLNPDCVRSVLIALESADYIEVVESGGAEFCCVDLDELYEELRDFTKEDIYYSVFNLAQAGYLDVSERDEDNATILVVNYITYDGHEFLDALRDDTKWGMVKKGLAAIRSYSLSAVASIAGGVTSAAISKYFASGA